MCDLITSMALSSTCGWWRGERRGEEERDSVMDRVRVHGAVIHLGERGSNGNMRGSNGNMASLAYCLL
jgi:hypothetical protein